MNSVNLYLGTKSLHIVAIISWMAGVLYYYRLLIYHCEHRDDSKISQLLSKMERRLYQYITVPAMSVAVISGICLIVITPDWMRQKWLHWKLLMVLFLIVSTFYGGSFLKGLPAGITSRKLRVLNEVPTLLMVIIVTLVVFKFS
jgi:protoporphyrinogen IX oxidase